jgi:hypothetical protein
VAVRFGEVAGLVLVDSLWEQQRQERDAGGVQDSLLAAEKKEEAAAVDFVMVAVAQAVFGG